jgi:hypothetical protein
MQLAFHMGFTEVALVGCDHSFAAKGPANKTVISGPNDSSHFAPNYFAGGVKWQLPDLARSELHYAIAKDLFEKHGRQIVNCTEGGGLELFDRRSLAEFLALKENVRASKPDIQENEIGNSRHSSISNSKTKVVSQK